MKTTTDFLDEIKEFHGLKSDYQLARLLQLTDSRISFYRTGKSRFDEDMCIRVARLLNKEPGYVMACVAAERTKSEAARAEWSRIARLLGGIAAAVAVISFTWMYQPVPTEPLPAFGLVAMADLTLPVKRSLYIMSNYRRLYQKACGILFKACQNLFSALLFRGLTI